MQLTWEYCTETCECDVDDSTGGTWWFDLSGRTFAYVLPPVCMKQYLQIAPKFDVTVSVVQMSDCSGPC